MPKMLIFPMMKLNFKSPYLSIEQFEPIELPSLAVLTGVNGSGKSHLLQAIGQGNVTIEGRDDPHVVLFNYETFRLENEGQVTADQVISERESAWQLFAKDQRINFCGTLTGYKNEIGEDVCTRLNALADDKEKSLWHLTRKDVEADSDYDALQKYKRQVQGFVNSNGRLKGKAETQAILAMIKKQDRWVDEFSEAEFKLSYEPYTLKSDFLPTQLGKIFTNYFSKYEQNQYDAFRNEKYGENHKVLTPEEFVKVHGPKPWEVVDEILGRLGSMPYRVNSPEQLHRHDRYQLELTHTERSEVHPQFSELSSGERILMALVASVYKSSSDRHFPDVLLLDEIDASLHPSMIQNLLDVINDVFLKNGVSIILVTHSPTTIALSPEESIFVMNRSGLKRIEKRSRGEALEILTEGFATLEKGLHVLDEVARTKVSVLTEGRNVAFIDAALKHAGIGEVEVVSGVESKTGKNQLKTLYDFFAAVPHDNKVVVVWDCDASAYKGLAELNSTYPFVFDQYPSNSLATKGIENLFDEERFEAFVKTTTTADGTVIRQFDESQKVPFEKNLLERKEPKDFARFAPLIEKLKALKGADK